VQLAPNDSPQCCAVELVSAEPGYGRPFAKGDRLPVAISRDVPDAQRLHDVSAPEIMYDSRQYVGPAQGFLGPEAGRLSSCRSFHIDDRSRCQVRPLIVFAA
jgi:hypothetical protein